MYVLQPDEWAKGFLLSPVDKSAELETIWYVRETARMFKGKSVSFPVPSSIKTTALMPTISNFYGINIQMFWNDHPPPHFHAVYAEDEAKINIRTLEVIEGYLPRRALALVLEWAEEHRAELMKDWELCSNNQPPYKIVPLP